MNKYYFTTYGDVYAGVEFEDSKFSNYKIIVQAGKKREYEELSEEAKTFEKIKEYANIFPVSAYVGEIDAAIIPRQQVQHNEGLWLGGYDRKSMFIFGAGASAFCVTGSRKTEFESDKLKPALGNGLFASIYKQFYNKYEGVRLSLSDLQGDNVNVEDFLEEEWKEVLENGNQAVMSRHINIQFYLQELLMEISEYISQEYSDFNLYAKLADKLQKINARDRNRHFAFVSFNQDTILEYFLAKYFRWPLNNLDAYIDVNDSPFCIFKPHGSWNWGWPFNDKVDDRQKTLFDNNVNFFNLYFNILGNYYDMVDWSSWGLERMLNIHRKGKLTINKSKLALFNSKDIGSNYPAILLPYRDKDEFTMPPEHFYQLDHYFSHVENLFIIGWKGNEALFNNVLNQKATSIRRIVIADPNPEAVEANLKDILARPGVIESVYNSFEDFVVTGMDKELKCIMP